MKFNKTRKNKNRYNQNINNNNKCIVHNEGFKSRVTNTITLTPYKPTDEQLNRFKILEQMIPDLKETTEKDIDNFILNTHKYHNDYLESVKNNTNIY
jgi:hypothetical protein